MDELLIIDWITIHFGKNPKNGGNPPREMRDENRRNFIILLFIIYQKCIYIESYIFIKHVQLIWERIRESMVYL